MIKSYFLTILAVIAVAVIAYLLWIIFIPMTVGQKVVDRKITQQSQQYVASQRSALVKLYQGYVDTQDADRKQAIKGQMCQIAVEIPRDEIPDYIRGSVAVCR